MTAAAGGRRADRALGNTIARALMVLLAQNLAGRIVTFANQIVLAWLLMPADFGVIGVALAVVSIAEIAVTIGIDDVVVQRGRKVRLWLGPAFRMSVGASLGVAALLGAASPLAAALFAVPSLAPILCILAVGLPFSAAALMPAAKLRSELRFNEVAAIAATELLVVQALTLALAVLGFGAFSFAIPVPLGAMLRAGAVWWRAPLDLSRPVRRTHVGYLVRHGSVVLGTRLMTTLLGYGDALVLGLVAPPAAVGAYFFAAKIATQPVTLLAANVTNVLFPALTRVSAEPERQRQAALSAVKILAYVILPCSFLQAAVAEPLMRFALGQKWAEAILPVQLLSIGLGFNALLWIAGAYMSARREFGRIFRYALANAVLFLACVGVGASIDGSRGTAVAACAFYALACPVELLLVFRTRALARDLVDLVLRPTLLAAAVAGAAYALTRFTPAGLAGALAAGAAALLGLALYAAMLRWADRPSWDDIMRRVRR